MKNTGTLHVALSDKNEIVMTRVFDAPRALVYEAFAKPELLKRWFGPRGHSLDVCEVDHRVGGGFRFVLRKPNGGLMGMRGRYVERAPPDRSVHMESFDDFPGEAKVTTVFVENDGQDNHDRVVGPTCVERSLRDGAEVRHGARRGRKLRSARRTVGGS